MLSQNDEKMLTQINECLKKFVEHCLIDRNLEGKVNVKQFSITLLSDTKFLAEICATTNTLNPEQEEFFTNTKQQVSILVSKVNARLDKVLA